MKAVLSISFFLCCCSSFTQPFRLHIGGGVATYYGELQQKKIDFSLVRPVGSIGATYNLTDKFALRADYSVAQLAGDDKKSASTFRRRQNLNFQTMIHEFSVMGEYDIYNYNDIVPYVFAGVGIFSFNPYTYDRTHKKVYLPELSTEGQGIGAYGNDPYSTTQFNIPFGGGLKYNVSEGFYVSFEGGIRKLFTDYLDDVSKFYIDKDVLTKERGALAAELAYRGDELPAYTVSYPKAGTPRGTKPKDWYYFIQLRLSIKIDWFDSERNFYSKGH